MSEYQNPALIAFLERLNEELLWAEVSIRRVETGFELRHAADRKVKNTELKAVTSLELRELAVHNVRGEFRPLKSAPDLRAGWILSCSGGEDLEFALNQVYPNSVVDWYFASLGPAPVVHYRQFTGRQTGMYRITQLLTDEQAGKVITITCDAKNCLKRRLWNVGGLEIDSVSAKSAIPCLEPCAVMIEMARKRARVEQADRGPSRMAAE